MFADKLFLFLFGCVRKKSDILLIKVDAIGDFIIWLDSAKKIRAFYLDKNISLVIDERNLDLAVSSGYFDECIPINIAKFNGNIYYRFKKLLNISSVGYIMVIHPTYSRSITLGDSIARCALAKDKIGYDGDYVNTNYILRKISDRWYTRLICANIEMRTEYEFNRHFVDALTGCKSLLSISNINFQGDLKIIEDQYCVIFPFASWEGKTWNRHKFIEIINFIHSNFNIKIVICGGKGDRIPGNSIIDELDFNVVNLIGETSLNDLVAIVKSAEFVLGNDSAGVHMAASLGVPSVCILGGGHYGRFLPYPVSIGGCPPITLQRHMNCFQCNWSCIHARQQGDPVKCVADITVQEVALALEHLHVKSIDK
jgi:ADP-heptose:LPS heptosyltransferase